MDGLGAIKEGTELEDYDIKYSRLRALSLPIGGGLFGTIVVGGIGYAAYLKYFKPKPKTFKQKVKDKLRRK